MNDRLPKLPGMTFDDRHKVNHHVPQCFNFLNGYRTYSRPATGIGKEPLKDESKDYCGGDESLRYISKGSEFHIIYVKLNSRIEN